MIESWKLVGSFKSIYIYIYIYCKHLLFSISVETKAPYRKRVFNNLIHLSTKKKKNNLIHLKYPIGQVLHVWQWKGYWSLEKVINRCRQKQCIPHNWLRNFPTGKYTHMYYTLKINGSFPCKKKNNLMTCVYILFFLQFYWIIYAFVLKCNSHFYR